METRFIYAIQHNVTKRIYIGCSANYRRVRQHFNALQHGNHQNKLMQKDCDEYGFDFTAHTIEVFSAMGNEYTQRERHWIAYFRTDDEAYGYNSDKWFSHFAIDKFPVYDEELMKNLIAEG